MNAHCNTCQKEMSMEESWLMPQSETFCEKIYRCCSCGKRNFIAESAMKKHVEDAIRERKKALRVARQRKEKAENEQLTSNQ